jgi:hypothetical protein
MLPYYVHDAYDLTLGQVVQRIIVRTNTPQNSRFYMCNNVLMNSPIEIDSSTEDLVEQGDLMIKIAGPGRDQQHVYIVDYLD